MASFSRIQISFNLGLKYLENKNIGQLIRQTILSQKNDCYHYIKEEMDVLRFNEVVSNSFLTISSAFNSFPHPDFYDWIKNIRENRHD